MQVLNTYVNKADTASGIILLYFLLVVSLFFIWLLRDDITRFCEHHTIGAFFYSYMKHVWKFLMGIVVIIIFVIRLCTPRQDHIYVEATVLPNYPIGPLYEKYEIVEKRGEIWVLEQRPTWVEDVVESELETEEEE